MRYTQFTPATPTRQ